MAHKSIPLTMSPLVTAGFELFEAEALRGGGVLYYCIAPDDSYSTNDYRRATDAEQEAMSYLRALEAMKGMHKCTFKLDRRNVWYCIVCGKDE